MTYVLTILRLLGCCILCGFFFLLGRHFYLNKFEIIVFYRMAQVKLGKCLIYLVQIQYCKLTIQYA